MKKIYIPVLLFLSPLWLYAQDLLILRTENTTGGNIEACEGIILEPGFIFEATPGKSMTLSINRSVCSPRQETVYESENKNYTITVTPLDESPNLQIAYGKVSIDRDSRALINIRYFDGLGRPIQTVQKKASPQGYDLVTALEYDNLGREWKNYLPVPVHGNRGALVSDILQKAKDAYNNDQKPFSETAYEPSPLNRMERQYGAGQAWNPNSNGTGGHPVSTAYLTNNNTDDYLKCAYYSVSGDNLAKNGNYSPNQLYVTEITDEDNNQSYEFKDKFDRVILTRSIDKTQQGANRLHDTYYVYDDFGNLRWVLSPMFGSVVSIPEACELYAYYYKYDGRNRCIEKKSPGGAPVYMVYDKADRLILTQDGEQRNKSPQEWTFNKYDVFGRLIISGVYPESKSRSELETEFSTDLIVESKGGYYGYTWSKMPRATYDKTLVVNHYDDYEHLLSQEQHFRDNLNYENKEGYGKRYESGNNPAKGSLVGTRIKMLDGSGEIVTAMYYDDKGRVVQTKSTNHLGGFDKEYHAYTFTGQPIKKQTEHSAPGKPGITEVYTYAYDHADRPTTTKYQLNGESALVLSSFSYNDKGLLEEKIQGGIATTTYSYNIRNWLTGISAGNNSFTQAIYYNESYNDNIPQYNGNISAVYYGNNGYLYTYDGLNRLKKGRYFSEVSANDNAFTEEIGLYDKNGNIKNLKRHAHDGPVPFLRPGVGGNVMGIDYGSAYLADDLTLDYRGNQIATISDAIPASASPTVGFVMPTATVSGDRIKYNHNGAMTHNYYNGIAGISYNMLNLPDKIRFMYGHSTQYSYDAAGVKRRVVHQTVKSNLNIPLETAGYTPDASDIQNTLTTDYCAGGHIVYENNVLKMILNPEGYAIKLPNGTYEYYYYAKDHLGNNREVYVSDMSTFSTRQRMDYYPFGMPHKGNSYWGYGTDNPELQPYKFGGKELDEMHGLDWYDQGARFFGTVIPVTPTQDPLAEKYYNISPYVQMANNPIKNIDLRGDSITVTNKDGGYLFMLNDESDGMTTYTAQQLYSKGIQWFAPDADNYMPLIGIADNLSESTSLKHFTSDEILTFAEKDRRMIDYRSGGSGDWKKSKQGADGYLMVTVDEKPYWADAVGQIPFAINKFRDEFLKSGGNRSLSSERTINAGRKYGDGNPFFPKADYSNGYDNAMIRNTANWASKNYYVGYNFLRNWAIYKRGSYNPGSLFNY